MNFREYLQKGHAIDVLLAMVPSDHEPYVGWSAIKKRLRRQGITVADGTYRSRAQELVKLGLAYAQAIDPLKSHYLLTSEGKAVATKLAEFLKSVDEILTVQSWREAEE